MIKHVLHTAVLTAVILGSGPVPAVGGDVCDQQMRADETAGCAALGYRHEITGLNSQYPSLPEESSFDVYSDELRERIRGSRKDLEDWPGIDVVDVNSPFELAPEPLRCTGGSTGGALLVHGLTDSPYLMRDIGRRLHARCLLVRAILLPGHGTVPGDLLEVNYEEWLRAVRAGIRSFRDVEGPVIVVGFSTGAAAALHTQLDSYSSDAVDALVLISPAVKPKSQWAFMANWFKVRKSFKSPEEYATHQWLEVATDRDYAKYESFPKNAGDQIHELAKAVRSLGCENLGIPIFMALSADDNTVSAEAARKCFDRFPNPGRRLLLYVKNGAITDENEHLIVRGIRDVDKQVLDFSHTALPVAPDNPHYGDNGDYYNCMHYIGSVSKWDACKDGGDGVMRGENTVGNVEGYTLQRLTFNPDFDGMMLDIGRFLDGVKRSRPEV